MGEHLNAHHGNCLQLWRKRVPHPAPPFPPNNMWAMTPYSIFVVWNSLLPSKHKKVKFFYVTTFFFQSPCEELWNVFWLSIKSFIFLHHALFMSNGLWGIQIKTGLDGSIKVFSWGGLVCFAWKNIIGRNKEPYKENQCFFPNLSCVICEHPYKNLTLNVVGGRFLQVVQKDKKMLQKKYPLLKPK
jgi:hypothetical protein